MIKITTIYIAHIIGEHICSQYPYDLLLDTHLSEYLHPMRDHLFTKHIEIVVALDGSDSNMKDIQLQIHLLACQTYLACC